LDGSFVASRFATIKALGLIGSTGDHHEESSITLAAFVLGSLIIASCASAQNVNPNHMDHHSNTMTPNPGVDSEMQEWAKQRLAKSPDIKNG